MSGVFGLLFVISLAGLVWGLISPSHLASKAKINKTVTRKHTGLGFGCLVIVFFVLVGVTTPKTINLKTTAAAAYNQAQPVVSTSQKTTTAGAGSPIRD